MSVECERGSRRGDSRYLSIPSPPEPSCPPQPRDGQPLPHERLSPHPPSQGMDNCYSLNVYLLPSLLSLGMDNRYPLRVHHLLTSLGKELRVYLFEVLLVDDAAGAFLHRDNQTQQRHTLPPLGQRLPEGRQIILPLWNLPEFW